MCIFGYVPGAHAPLTYTLSHSMPRADLRGEALALRRRSGRHRLQLHLGDVQISIVARCDRMLAQ